MQLTEDQLYALIDAVAASGQTGFIDNISAADFQFALKYRQEHNTAVRFHWCTQSTQVNPGHLHIRGTSKAHSHASANSAKDFLRFNIALTGDVEQPLDLGGDSEVTDPGIYSEPDLQVQLIGRLHDSPNLVGEVHFESNSSHQQVKDKAASYIELTNGVMSVLVYTVWRTGAMFVYELRRTLGTRLFTSHNHISFGTAALHPNAYAALAVVFPGVHFVGRGYATNANQPIAYPHCNAEGMPLYQVNLPATHLMALDLAGVQLYVPPEGAALPANFAIDLHRVQQRILRRL